MIKNSYSKDEVQLMFEYINKLEQKQKLLEETIKQIVLENNNKLDTINYKINKLEHENIKKDNHIESLEDIIKELAHENNNNFNVLNSKLDKLDKEIITIEKNKEMIEHIIKENSHTNSQVLIGFRYFSDQSGIPKQPIFCPLNTFPPVASPTFEGNILKYASEGGTNIYTEIMIESLGILSKHQKIYFDLNHLTNSKIKIIDRDHNIIIDYTFQLCESIKNGYQHLKILKKHCDEYNIELRIGHNDIHYNKRKISDIINEIN